MTTASLQTNSPMPLQLVASPYGYAALLDAEGNEQPITESMIRRACDEARDALCSLFMENTNSRQPRTT